MNVRRDLKAILEEISKEILEEFFKKSKKQNLEIFKMIPDEIPKECFEAISN